GRNSQKLFLWKWDEEEPRELQGSIRTTGLSFSPDGKLLAAVSEMPNRLHVWEVLSRRLLYQRGIPAEGYYFSRSVAFTPDGATLLLPMSARSGGRRFKTELLEPASGRSKGSVPGAAGWMAVSPDSKLLACVWGQALRSWDLATRKELAANDKAHSSP